VNALLPLASFDSVPMSLPAETRAEIAVLKGIVAANVMSHESRRPIYSRQREIIQELCAILASSARITSNQASLPISARRRPEVDAMRAIIDQVASLTDQSALVWHERLSA